MGIRGVGAFYYIAMGIDEAGGMPRPLLPMVLDAITLSVFLHGATAGVALKRYLRNR